MHRRTRASLALVVVAALGVGSVAATPLISFVGAAEATGGGGQEKWTPPRTPWGDPDLQGTWPSTHMVGVPFERPEQFGNRLFLTDEEFTARQKQAARQQELDNADFSVDKPAAEIVAMGEVGGPTSPPPFWLERGEPSRQSSLIVDPPNGKMPPMTPEGTERQRSVKNTYVMLTGFNSFEDLGPYDRCITRGVVGSMMPVIYNNGNQILQTPGYVVLRQEMIHETRIIPLDGRPQLSPALRSYMGDSHGHWEGNTLVVRTTNLNGKTGVQGNGNLLMTSDALELVERFTRTGSDTIQYEVTITDPKTWTRPWKVAFPLRRDPSYRIFEYACHEGNHAMSNILSASRADEQRGGAAAAPRPQTPPAEDPLPTPAFKNQTRAPQPARPSRYAVETVASGLSRPWSLAFLPDGRMVVTERQGRMRIVDHRGKVSEPLGGLPPVRAVAAEGLHDVVLDPQFATNRLVYFTYFAPPAGEPGGAFPVEAWQQWLMQSPEERPKNPVGFERVARARLSADEKRLENVEVILEAGDRRLVFAADGTLYVTAATPAGGGNVPIDDLPQRLNNYYGKVLRINRDGSIPRDNPFVQRAGARPAIYTYGLRDPEGAAINPRSGQLWTVEHGVKGGDEINIARSGANYGFPVIGYGRKYSGEPIGDGLTAKEGMEQPVYFWNPDIAPSGMLFYTGNLFPQWKGNLFIGAMVGKHLVRLVLEGDRVIAEEPLLADLEQRIRDVRQGPDDALYVLTDEDNGRVLRIVPSSGQQAAPGAAQRIGIAAGLQRSYNGSKANITATAEKLSDADYTFKPTPEMRSFGQLMGHIADYNYIFCAPAKGGTNPNEGNSFENKTTKAEFIKALADSFAYCDQVFTSLTDETAGQYVRQGPNEITRAASLLSVIAHNNEEYGYAAVYLRLKNVLPPSTERVQRGRGGR